MNSKERTLWFYNIFRQEHLKGNLLQFLYDVLDLSVVKSISMLLDLDEGEKKLFPVVNEEKRNAILNQQKGLTTEPEYSLDSGDLERFVKNDHQFSVQLEDCIKYSLQQRQPYVFIAHYHYHNLITCKEKNTLYIVVVPLAQNQIRLSALCLRNFLPTW